MEQGEIIRETEICFRICQQSTFAREMKTLPFFKALRGEGGTGRTEGLTSHRVGTGHEVQRDGVGRVGGHALQVALWDFVEAVGGGGHVFIHPVQERLHAWFLRMPLLQVSPGALAVFPASLHVLRVAGQCGWSTRTTTILYYHCV